MSTLKTQIHELAPVPKEVGRIDRIVSRPLKGERTMLQNGTFTPEEGLRTDRWGSRVHQTTNRQVSIIRTDIIDLLAGEADPSLSGDNLHVHLDISSDNLPAGSQLKIGTALFELTPENHVPCHLFKGRFGPEAFSIAEDPELADIRVRGLFLKVLKEGSFQVGDAIEVIRKVTD